MEVDYNVYESKLIGVPLTGPNSPTRILNNIYFPNDENMSDKEIVGINVVTQSFLPNYYLANVNYVVLKNTQCSSLCLSIYDRENKGYTINYIPLNSLISPASVSNMKFPFHKMKVRPEMTKSFLRLNSVSGFNPAINNLVLLNVYYKKI